MQYRILPVTTFNQNCSLLWCDQTKEGALVDPGGEAKWLSQNIEKCGVTVKKILLTHGHFDHVGAAKELAILYDVPIVGPHHDEMPILDNLPSQCHLFGIEESISPLTPDIWLLNNDTVNIGMLVFSVLHCPGHSPGHVIFLNKSEKFALMGDVLFKGSIGRTDLLGGDMKKLAQSLKHQLTLLEDDFIFLPGHGPMSTLGHERKTNPFLRRLNQ